MSNIIIKKEENIFGEYDPKYPQDKYCGFCKVNLPTSPSRRMSYEDFVRKYIQAHPEERDFDWARDFHTYRSSVVSSANNAMKDDPAKVELYNTSDGICSPCAQKYYGAPFIDKDDPNYEKYYEIFNKYVDMYAPNWHDPDRGVTVKESVAHISFKDYWEESLMNTCNIGCMLCEKKIAGDDNFNFETSVKEVCCECVSKVKTSYKKLPITESCKYTNQDEYTLFEIRRRLNEKSKGH